MIHNIFLTHHVGLMLEKLLFLLVQEAIQFKVSP